MPQPQGQQSVDLPQLCAALTANKKKGCKKSKCSKWKGGKCRCGRE